MTSGLRFWPLATLILLPLVVLAALAGWFLAGQRRVVMANAASFAQSAASGAALIWEEMAGNAIGDEVVLYDDVPAPATPSSQSLELDRALREKDYPALTLLRDAKESQGFSASGLPVRVLAGWALFKSGRSPDDGYWVASLAVKKEPSAISESIVQALRASRPEVVKEWEEAQENQRELRRIVRAGLLPAAPATEKAGEPAGRQVVSLLPQLGGSGLVCVQRLADGKIRIGRNVRSPEVAAGVAEERMFHGTSRWAKIEIKETGALPRAGHVPLAIESRPGFTVFVYLLNETILYNSYTSLVWWCSGVIGTALVIALLGLWTARRSLLRERKLGEMKSQFVSSVSHELRAPVGSMRLMAEALASRKVTGAAADEFHRLMASEGARLSGLIENVLDYARIEQGRKRYTFAETDVGALVQDAVKLMAPQAEERGQRISADTAPLTMVPRVDAAALQQALINLIENALKFSPPDTAVKITLSEGPSRDAWSLAVTDQGAGIPKEEHTRIFERFYRPGNELRRETTGTGIGLAIVKHVVEGHGGRIRVESEPGKGSVFTMEFPVRQPTSDL
ncbi:MAG TPA: HAMP domain-containing sensor histidine kinase [Verrucomicrobiales bacterium]|nr:HAMP domain-containing sensor histidine kinase [Verrucomicrobiales bacterium]